MERRYPIIVHEFGLRQGSAGNGKWKGGEGVRRVFEFTEKLQVSILSEVGTAASVDKSVKRLIWVLSKKRRTRQPYGMEGGGPGGFGRNTWIKQCRQEDGDLAEMDQESLRQPGGRSQVHPRKINIGGKATTMMGKGDRLVIETPGGGAWGAQRGTEEEETVWRYEGSARGSWKDRESRQAEF